MSPAPLNAAKKIVCIILLTLLCPVCSSAKAGTTPSEIIMASEEWTNATNRDGTGLYWDIFRAVYEPVGIKTKFVIQSFDGSVNLVKKKQVAPCRYRCLPKWTGKKSRKFGSKTRKAVF